MNLIKITLIAGALLSATAGAASAQTTSWDRTYTGANGGSVTLQGSAGDGAFTGTRTAVGPNGGTYDNTRTAARGAGYNDTRAITKANGATYGSQRHLGGGLRSHSWSGVTAGGHGFGGSRWRAH